MKKTTGILNPYNGLPVERVGTTGSREGPVTSEQADAAIWLFQQMWPFKEFHHGLCHGWDEWTHRTIRKLFGPWYKGTGPQIHGWPGPLNNAWMATSIMGDCDVFHEPREFKARDREIAWHTQVLVSGPKQLSEIARSGTWYTMRQALAMLRPIYFVRCDGVLVTDWESEMNESIKKAEAKDVEAYLKGLHPFEVPPGRTRDPDDDPPIQPRAREFKAHELGIDARFDLDEAFGIDPLAGAFD